MNNVNSANYMLPEWLVGIVNFCLASMLITITLALAVVCYKLIKEEFKND
jgi:hypothetical protein